MGCRRRSRRNIQPAGNQGNFYAMPVPVGHLYFGDVLIPKHFIIGRGEFISPGQVKPDLEEFQWIILFLVNQREHFAVLQSGAGRHPLHVAFPIATGRSMGIGMIDKAPQNNGDCFKSTMRMGRKTGNRFTMIHAPTVFQRKILSQITSFQRSGRPHFIISGWVVIQVVNTKQKGIVGFPIESQWFNVENDAVVHTQYSSDSLF